MNSGYRGQPATNQIDIDQLFTEGMSPSEREVKRIALRAATRRQHCEPLTGAWYWAPLPSGRGSVEWEIQEFFDCWGRTDHVHIWRHVLDSLTCLWRRSFVRIDYCSLPRGRVAMPILHGRGSTRQPAAAIYHGNDSPLGERGIALVRKSFNLPFSSRAIFDEHEQCIAGQPQALSRVLGIDLGITGVVISDLDYDD